MVSRLGGFQTPADAFVFGCRLVGFIGLDEPVVAFFDAGQLFLEVGEFLGGLGELADFVVGAALGRVGDVGL